MNEINGEASSGPPNPTQYSATGLLRNSLLVAGTQVSAVLMAVLYIVIARVLGDAAFGEFTLALSIAALLSIVQGWGRNRYSAIVAARDPDRSTEIVADNLGASVPFTAVYFLAVAATALIVTGERELVLMTLLLAADLAVAAYSKLLRLVMRVHDAFLFDTLGVLGERTSVVLAAGGVLLLRPSGIAVATAFLFGRAVGACLTSLFYAREVGVPSLRIRREAIVALFRAGTPLALRGGLNSLNLRADMLILGSFRASSEVGWYGAVYRVLEGFLMLPSIILGALGPHLSANFGSGRHHVVARLLQRAVKYLLVLGGLISTGLLVLSESLIVLVFGQEYASAAPALRILAVVVMLGFLRLLVIEFLDNVDEREATVKIFAVAVVLNIALNLALVPSYGIIGAAWSTVASETVLTISLLWALRSARYPLSLASAGLPVLAGMISAGGLMWWLSASPLLASAFGGVAYVTLVTILGVWDDKDRDMVEQLCRGVRSRFPSFR